MIHAGECVFEGIAIKIVRRHCRRINLRVDQEGNVFLTVPKLWVTLREGETFLRSKWAWVLKTRAKALSRLPVARVPVTKEDLESLQCLLTELNEKWSGQLDERDVVWKIRKVKSVWGCCHWRSRSITYNAELAHAPRELVEYVVVHEFTHFAVHGHGPGFYELMDERLPNWKAFRKRLNDRDWMMPVAPNPAGIEPARKATVVQDTLPGFGGR